MALQNYAVKVHLIKCALLMYTITNAILVDENDPRKPLTVAKLEKRNIFNKSASIKHDRESAEHIIERPYHIWNTFKEIFNGSDVKMYKEVHKDEHFKRLCWAEIFIITEDNETKNKKLSREFSIILENPGDISQEDLAEKVEVESYDIWVGDTKKSKPMNFTTVSKTDECTIKQHKTLYCGAGPVLIKEYFDWPKLNKQKIEIRLSSTTPITWGIRNENGFEKILSEKHHTEPSYSTFDTTHTNGYLPFTDPEFTTESLLKMTETPLLLQTLAGEESKLKINSNKGASLLYESGETFDFLDKANVPHASHGTKDKTIDNINHGKKFFDDSLMGTKSELLKQKMYFKKLKHEEQYLNDPWKAKKHNYVFNSHFDNHYLFDLLFPHKSIFKSLCEANRHNKFFIRIKVQLEHRTVDVVNGKWVEESESVMGMEEDSIFYVSSKHY